MCVRRRRDGKRCSRILKVVLTDNSSITNNIVSLVAGRDVSGATIETFSVHETILQKRSPFFRAALDKGWREGQERRIELPEDHPDLVNAYAEFVYDKNVSDLCENERGNWTSQDLADEYYHQANLYVLGEKLQDDEFCNAVITKFINLIDASHGVTASNTRHYPSTITVRTIYEGTPQGSPARKLMVHLYCTYAREDWLNKSNSISHSLGCPEFLLDLATKMITLRDQPKRSTGGNLSTQLKDFLKPMN